MTITDKPFPVGYLMCAKCRKPAVWVLDQYDAVSTPIPDVMPLEEPTYADVLDVSIKLSYRLVGYKHDTVKGKLQCDSCDSYLDQDNICEGYMILFTYPKYVC